MIWSKFNLLAFVSSSVKWGMITSVRTKWDNGCKWSNMVLAILRSSQKEHCSSSFTRQAERLRALGTDGNFQYLGHNYTDVYASDRRCSIGWPGGRNAESSQLSTCLLILFSLHLLFTAIFLICKVINMAQSHYLINIPHTLFEILGPGIKENLFLSVVWSIFSLFPFLEHLAQRKLVK